MIITEDALKRLQSIAASAVKERCGVILGNGSTLEITNVAKDNNSFVFDKASWFKLLNSNATIAGIWHTHPDKCTPSDADIASAKRFPYKFLIVTKDDYLWLEIS